MYNDIIDMESFRNYPLPHSKQDAIKAYKEVYRVKRMTAKESQMFKDFFQGYFDTEASFCFWFYEQREDFDEIKAMKQNSNNLRMTVAMHFSHGNYSFKDGYVFGY